MSRSDNADKFLRNLNVHVTSNEETRVGSSSKMLLSDSSPTWTFAERARTYVRYRHAGLSERSRAEL
jgi:replicative superfamily II helicase